MGNQITFVYLLGIVMYTCVSCAGGTRQMLKSEEYWRYGVEEVRLFRLETKLESSHFLVQKQVLLEEVLCKFL